MKKRMSVWWIILLPFGLSAQVRPVGINLTGVVDWSTELVFTNAFLQSREWIPHDTIEWGAAWDSGVSVPLNKNGYPLEIPYRDGIHPPQLIRALMNWGPDYAYPSGKYRLVVAGSGQVRLWGAAEGRFTCPVDTLVPVRAAAGGVVLEIERSLASDPIRDIRFIYPKYVDTYKAQLFTDEFLRFVSDFETIRFMDWANTNGTKVSKWSERTPEGYCTQAKSSGVAWEYVIALCNTTHKNAWINVPHLADDTYIRELAAFFRDRLDPGLKIYLEYSNEVWNGIFAQNAYATNAAQALAYTGEPWEKAWKYTVRRSADMFHIFETVFGASSNRLVKVIPCFAVNDWLTDQMLMYMQDPLYNPWKVKADAIAIAPYFAHDVANQIGERKEEDTISTSEILARTRASMAAAYASMDAQKAVADKYGVKMLAYEGGSHIVATWAHVNNEQLTKKLIEANRSPEFQDIYCAYSDYWYNHTKGDLFCFFSSHVTPTQWGSWGLKEYMDQPNAPKYQALQNCVFSKNTTQTLWQKPSSDPVFIFPNPTADGTFVVRHAMHAPQVHLYNADGQALPAHFVVLNTTEIQVHTAAKGLIWGILEDKTTVQGFQVVCH